ncbi:hypothetical protein AVEN_87603-1 [Araneus ventricosus]|uniref:Uncharacterized protein n=1 Tax=Araneus ventricosus TaxID=182803 RepID=A0A4Y2LQX5_ARAVE|nr:hypothetical protein AVEN_87603-1 [Araneus ventricosus]
MDSPLAYPRGKEGKSKNSKGRQKLERRSDTRVPRGREARHTWRRCVPEGCSCRKVRLFCSVLYPHCWGNCNNRGLVVWGLMAQEPFLAKLRQTYGG